MALQEFKDPQKSRKDLDENAKQEVGYGEG